VLRNLTITGPVFGFASAKALDLELARQSRSRGRLRSTIMSEAGFVALRLHSAPACGAWKLTQFRNQGARFLTLTSTPAQESRAGDPGSPAEECAGSSWGDVPHLRRSPVFFIISQGFRDRRERRHRTTSPRSEVQRR